MKTISTRSLKNILNKQKSQTCNALRCIPNAATQQNDGMCHIIRRARKCNDMRENSMSMKFSICLSTVLQAQHFMS
uniref:Uncharacterized protein n=1 Tax=Onchocerca volvulus TaxID=6282 RepID=A0A8R1XM24_ONCVO